MAGKAVAVVLVPRFTTYLGPQVYYLEPLPVSAYAGLQLAFWHGPYLGGATSVALLFEFSNDLDSWHPCAGGPWPVGPAVMETPFQVALDSAWFRFAVVVGGPGSGVTCWASGAFELREK
jgi:hypothetical protein